MRLCAVALLGRHGGAGLRCAFAPAPLFAGAAAEALLSGEPPDGVRSTSGLPGLIATLRPGLA